MASLDQREFHCGHCHGRILIPYDLPVTTAPCPHCGATVTSPPPPEKVEEVAPPPPFEPTIPVPPPRTDPVPQEPVEPVEPVEPPQPVAPEPIAPVQPEEQPLPVEPAAPAPKVPAATAPAPAPRSGKSALKTGLVLLAVLLFLGGAAFVAIEILPGFVGRPEVAPVTSEQLAERREAERSRFIRSGWKEASTAALAEFLEADTVEEKLPLVIPSEDTAQRLEEFYRGAKIDESDTPVDGFAPFELSEEDRRRGIFLLQYNRPPQFAMSEFFRPIVTLDVQYGVEDPDLLLSAFGRIGNFAMEPMRVQAFFKLIGDELKLDWDTYAQTKYRTFKNFVELPDPGNSRVFRVIIAEDVPEGGEDDPSARTYRLIDPAHAEDSARVNVPLDSELGRTLSVLNWRGIEGATETPRTATVELEWKGDPVPELRIKEFICWEFLGLGGEAGNHDD